MTKRSSCVFSITQYSDGTPWIMIEIDRSDLGIPSNSVIGFDLHEGTTFAQAKELADRLNESIANITVTDLPQ